jgi:hypothetical protein
MSAPEGAQLSEDGKYWWDGASWQDNTAGGQSQQPAGSSQPASSGSEPAAGSQPDGQLSEDGQYRWDGTTWQPVDSSQAGGSGTDAGLPEGTVLIPQDVLDELADPDSFAPETAAMYYAGDGETYVASLVGEMPTPDDDTAIA